MAVDISPNKDGGVLKEIIKEGVGDETAPPGSNVKVHYTGTLLSGEKFDSSKDRNEPFTFSLAAGQVIKAWDIGVATMKKGEVAMLTCASDYAYGKNGSPPKIPPNATLKFEVEMIDWTGEDLSPEKDGAIERLQIKAGEGYTSPNDGAVVNIHIKGTYNGKVFDERDVSFTLGEGEAEGIVEGIEKALEKFKKGEVSKLKLKSSYAFGHAGKPEFNIPSNANVEYIVELKNFEKGAETWSMDAAQKIEQAKMFKEKGTGYFKQNKYNLALKMYKKMVSLIDDDYDYKDEQIEERKSLLLSAHLNLALCYLKIDQNSEAKESCNKALELSPNNEKALFRRGQAYLGLASPDIAIKDFKSVVNIEPKNTAAIKQISVCNDLIKKELAKEKKLYANMFEKFAKEDKQ